MRACTLVVRVRVHAVMRVRVRAAMRVRVRLCDSAEGAHSGRLILISSYHLGAS